ncbi:MAG: TetR/AcrR family transcriptional regulator [Burkholderiales bacterium]
MNTPDPAAAKPSLKEQMLHARREAIVTTANRLLAEKGFEAMTVDEIAAAVGIAKANLFQLFPSKEDLATAAMVRVVRRALEFLHQLPESAAPLARLQAVAAWAMELQIAGEMPLVPSQSSPLRKTLLASVDYSAALKDVSDVLLGWIEAAQADGTLTRLLPAEVVLHTMYARAADPVVDYLKAQGDYSGPEIIELVQSVSFDGLKAR